MTWWHRGRDRGIMKNEDRMGAIEFSAQERMVFELGFDHQTGTEAKALRHLIDTIPFMEGQS